MSGNKKNNPNILPLRQQPHTFLRTVRAIAEDTKKILWSAHSRERFAERDIAIRMALDVIRKGEIRGDIVSGKFPGEWKAKIAYPIPGRREVGVVIILVKETRIFVKTVEWED